MKVAVLGTGIVGQTLASGLLDRGYEVTVGTRDVDASLAQTEGKLGALPFGEWAKAHPKAAVAAFAGAAEASDVVFNATSGDVSLAALTAAGAKNLSGKLLIDVANPLDFSRGFPPRLSICNDDSLAEQIQKAFPDARVVKTLNTVTAPLMTNPAAAGKGDHTMFVCGNDDGAKKEAGEILAAFGWRDIVDLGDLAAARGMEMYLPLWLRLMGTVNSPMFNVKLVR